MITGEIKGYVQRSVLCWLATVDSKGIPNVSPKEIFLAYGESRILIANIASPGSVRNITKEARVCVSFVDVFVQKGVKLRGEAHLVQRVDSRYPELVSPLEEMTGGKFPISSVIEVYVNEVEEIRAPSYQFYPETTEEDQVKGAMAAYGVRSV